MIVVTGTLHVEGGLSKSIRTSAKGESATRIVTTEERSVSKERREGNVVAANYMRRIRDLNILRTPFGALVDPVNLVRIKNVIAQAKVDSAAFNRLHEKCTVYSTMLWEPLKGTRLIEVLTWIEFKRREGDEEVRNALALLKVESAVA
jgi:hypothetical protein